MARKRAKKRGRGITAAADEYALKRVVSGGETGADQGALLAARACGITTGGVAARDYKTSRGHCQRRFLRTQCGLRESKEDGHKAKDQENVNTSDGVIAFRLRVPKSGAGTERTLSYAHRRSYSRWDLIGLHETELHEPSVAAAVGPSFMRIDSGYKPLLVLFDVSAELDAVHADVICRFLRENRIACVNVAGHGEGLLPTPVAERILTKAFLSLRAQSDESSTSGGEGETSCVEASTTDGEQVGTEEQSTEG